MILIGLKIAARKDCCRSIARLRPLPHSTQKGEKLSFLSLSVSLVGVTGFEPATSSSRTTSTFVLSVNQAWDSLQPGSKTAFNLFFAARSRHVFLYSPRALNPYVGLR